MNRFWSASLGVAGTLLMTATSLLVADEAKPSGSADLRVILSLTRVDKSGSKPVRSIELLVPIGGSGIKSSVGERVPIAATTFNTNVGSQGALAPITSYTYQNIGSTVEMRAGGAVEGGLVGLTGSLEESSLVAKAGEAPGQPTVSMLTLYFDAHVPVGAPAITLGRFESAGTGAIVVDLKAEWAR